MKMTGKEINEMIEFLKMFEEYLNIDEKEVDREKIEKIKDEMIEIEKGFSNTILKVVKEVENKVKEKLGDLTNAELKVFVEMTNEDEKCKGVNKLMQSLYDFHKG